MIKLINEKLINVVFVVLCERKRRREIDDNGDSPNTSAICAKKRLK